MRRTQKNSSNSRSPVSPQGKRASVTTLCRSEDTSFVFAYWQSVDILLEGQPCHTDPGVIGSFKRLLNAILEADDPLGFIEACSWCRSIMMIDGAFYLDVFKRLDNEQIGICSSQPRWVRGLSKTLDKVFGGERIVHPSESFNRLATFFRLAEAAADSYSFRAIKRGRVRVSRLGIIVC